MDISLINRTSIPCEAYLSFFKKIASSAEQILNLKQCCQLSVTFVRSRTIHQINLEYRGIDRPTDVISFAINDIGFKGELAEEAEDLGDIFINIDYAKKQAEQYGHSLKREIGFLFTHGMLHCLGYDHMKTKDEKIMFALQDQILDPIVSRKKK
ncbi:MAG: rRNA maturation RNase YbeY [Erysipelotrichia bacterium]|nr:rRNA maturation RNase YbeY [Erysipelotrichia bacterium]